MANIKISAMTPDASIGGGELLPVSDSGASKSVTTAGLKNYVVDSIEALAAGTAVTDADSVFILHDGVLKPVDIDLVAQHAIDTIWGKVADTVPLVTDIMPIKTGSTEKTITLTVLSERVRATIEAAILDMSNLAAAGALAGADLFLVTQGTTGKKVTLTEINTAIYAALVAYVTALSAVTVSADADVFYCIQGGIQKKVTLATIKTYLGTTGYAEIFFPATSMVGSETDGAGETAGEELYLAEYATNHVTHPVHLFDGSVQDESVEWNHVMPADWDCGTIKFKALWAPGDAAANVGEWVKLTLAAGALANDDALDSVLGSGQDVTDEVIADDDLHVTAASPALTVGGAPAVGSLIHFKLTRDFNYNGAGSAMDVPLRLIGVLIQYRKSETVAAW
jgi:hypothetical protein